jgi:hypothetical protein
VVVLKNCHSYSTVAVELPLAKVAVLTEVIAPANTSPEHIVVVAAVLIVPASSNSGTYTVIESVALQPAPFSVVTVKTVSAVMPAMVAVATPVVVVNSKVLVPYTTVKVVVPEL